MKRYLITGAASGIGLATARRLAEDAAGDCRIVMVDRDGASLKAAADAVRALGAEAVAAEADLADDAAFAAIAAAAGDKLDGVVSNAGIIQGGMLATIEPAAFDRVLNVNLRGAWMLARTLHPQLKAARGAYVATASILATEACAGVGAYAMSKAALLMMVRQLSLEWAADGVRCNCVSPGSTVSKMTEAGFKDPVRRAEREAGVPLGRLGSVEDSANAIAFLLSERAAYVTGTNMLVDGGYSNALMFDSTPAVEQ